MDALFNEFNRYYVDILSHLNYCKDRVIIPPKFQANGIDSERDLNIE